MILRRLCEAAPQFGFPPPGYQEGPVKWLIQLDAQGRCLNIVRMTGDETRKNDPGKRMHYPATATPRSGTKAPPQLLTDKASYALGFSSPGASEREVQKARDTHQQFCELLEHCAAATGAEALQSVLKSLTDRTYADRLPDDLKPGDVMTFSVDGQLPIDDPGVRDYWAGIVAAKKADRSAGTAVCLVCGKSGLVASPHPKKIKRVPGGQTSGCTLVAVNADAFDSYGHQQALSQSPICWDCALTYAEVLEVLLADPAHRFRLYDQLAYVFWTRDPSDFSLNMLADPQPEEVKALLQSVQAGKQQTIHDTNQFYALALSGSSARIAIRDWLETTITHAKDNLADYFAALDLVDHEGQPGNPISLMALLGATIPSKGQNPWKDLPPNLPVSIVRAALNGGPMPQTLLYRAVARARSEQGLTRPRAALIKLCLLRSAHKEEGLELTADLNPDLQDPAYLCGRLLAILESVQHAAIPGAKATLVDRYYGTASSAPASVFGNLIRQAQAHLAKLRKTNEGAHYRLQQAVEGVAAQLGGFPKTLTLTDQAKFGLGYYQQRAADRAAAIEAKARKAAKNETADNEGGDTNV